ncbi:MAG: hypothetical protein DMF25_07590 [Verrucomicrobia bacterium]|nr:MAG: hypothetical protein DMF25_07590 [Verrucomicrobiota bacterium]
MASRVGSAEEIRKLRRLQEFVGLSAHAFLNRICSKASPGLVSMAEFDDEPICLFVRIETAARRQTAKCLYWVTARHFDDQSGTCVPQISRWNTTSSHRFRAIVRGTQINRLCRPNRNATDRQPKGEQFYRARARPMPFRNIKPPV